MQALGSLWKGKRGRLGELTARRLSARLSSGKVEAAAVSHLGAAHAAGAGDRPHSIPGVLLLLCYLRNGFVKVPACLECPSWLPPGDGVSPWAGGGGGRVWCCGVACAWSPLLPVGLLCPAMAPAGASPYDCAPSSNK